MEGGILRFSAKKVLGLPREQRMRQAPGAAACRLPPAATMHSPAGGSRPAAFRLTIRDLHGAQAGLLAPLLPAPSRAAAGAASTLCAARSALVDWPWRGHGHPPAWPGPQALLLLADAHCGQGGPHTAATRLEVKVRQGVRSGPAGPIVERLGARNAAGREEARWKACPACRRAPGGGPRLPARLRQTGHCWLRGTWRQLLLPMDPPKACL